MLKYKRRLSAALALFVILPLIASGCKKNDDDDDGNELITNIVTEITSETAETSAPFFVPEGQLSSLEIVLLDEDGNPLFDEDGNPVTSISELPVNTAALSTAAGTTRKIEDEVTRAPSAPTAVVPTSNVKLDDKFAYNTLTEREKILYKLIQSHAEHMIWNVRGTSDIPQNDWSKIYGMVWNQEPQLFWMNGSSRLSRIMLNEIDSDKVAAMQKEIDAVVSPILREAQGKAATFDKVKVFHDWLVLNVDYAQTDPYHETIYGAFVLKKAQCAGYAKSFKYLCDLAGISSMVVSGSNGSGTSHAWNIVAVNGNWYNMDVMWNDPTFNPPRRDYIRNTFFLVPDSWIHNNTHHEINVKKLKSGTFTYFRPPACTSTAQNYFTVNNLVFSDAAAADKEIKAQIDRAVAGKKHVVEIRAANKQVYDAVVNKKREYQTYAQGKSSSVRGLADECNVGMLSIQFNVLYN